MAFSGTMRPPVWCLTAVGALVISAFVIAAAVVWASDGRLYEHLLTAAKLPDPSSQADLQPRSLQQRVEAGIALRNRSLAALDRFVSAIHSPNFTMPRAVQWEPFRPVVECSSERRLGSEGDGGKWVCVTPKLAHRARCLVYSFGSDGRPDFEQAIYDAFGCEIHVFDPTLDEGEVARMQPLVDRGVLRFHPWGIHKTNHMSRLFRNGKKYISNMKTLTTIMTELGHKDSALDILKIDVEGFEWLVVPEFTGRPGMPVIGQLQLEIHDDATRLMRKMPPLGGRPYQKIAYLFELLEAQGLYIFHTEVNAYHDTCSEFAFVHQSLFPVLTTFESKT